MLDVDLDGSRRIQPAHVGASSIQTDRVRSRQIIWMIKKDQAFDEPNYVFSAHDRAAGSSGSGRLLVRLRHGNALHEHPETAKQVDIAYQGRTSLAVRRVSWAHERDNHLVTHSLAVA